MVVCPVVREIPLFPGDLSQSPPTTLPHILLTETAETPQHQFSHLSHTTVKTSTFSKAYCKNPLKVDTLSHNGHISYTQGVLCSEVFHNGYTFPTPKVSFVQRFSQWIHISHPQGVLCSEVFTMDTHFPSPRCPLFRGFAI